MIKYMLLLNTSDVVYFSFTAGMHLNGKLYSVGLNRISSQSSPPPYTATSKISF